MDPAPPRPGGRRGEGGYYNVEAGRPHGLTSVKTMQTKEFFQSMYNVIEEDEVYENTRNNAKFHDPKARMARSQLDLRSSRSDVPPPVRPVRRAPPPPNRKLPPIPSSEPLCLSTFASGRPQQSSPPPPSLSSMAKSRQRGRKEEESLGLEMQERQRRDVPNQQTSKLYRRQQSVPEKALPKQVSFDNGLPSFTDVRVAHKIEPYVENRVVPPHPPTERVIARMSSIESNYQYVDYRSCRNERNYPREEGLIAGRSIFSQSHSVQRPDFHHAKSLHNLSFTNSGRPAQFHRIEPHRQYCAGRNNFVHSQSVDRPQFSPAKSLYNLSSSIEDNYNFNVSAPNSSVSAAKSIGNLEANRMRRSSRTLKPSAL